MFDPRTRGCLCDECPLRGGKPVPPEGDLNAAELIVVSDVPHGEDVKKGRPFSGAPGQKLHEMIAKIGVPRSRLWLTYAVLCRTDTPGVEGINRYDPKTYLAWLRLTNRGLRKEKRPELASPFDCCGPRLWWELMQAEEVAKKRGQPNGAVVIPIGNNALYAITSKKQIMKWRGSPLVIEVPE